MRSILKNNDSFFYGLSRERFSEISQNFHSAGYMPSARSILLQSSKNHLAILRIIVLRSNLKSNLQISASNFTYRDQHLENANLNLRRFASAKLCRHLKSVVVGGD